MSSERNPEGRPAWARDAGELLGSLGSDRENGLDENQVEQRRREFGPNSLRTVKSRSVWRILLEQFKSLIIALLAAAAVLSFAFGEVVEAVAIMAVILINAVIGFATELRATRSMEALKKLGAVQARVIRGGVIREVGAEDLVPGDVVVLEGGDVVTADMRLVEASRLQADESALTGESLPVSKSIETLDAETHLPDRRSMLFKGTAVTRGSGLGLVVSTGMNTEIGRISSLVEQAEDEQTPLEKRLNRLGNRLIWVTLAVALLTAVSGILAGKQVLLMVKTSIALAVAAIPEGLPIVATIALARGMWRMARRNVLINRLSAVETLGATTVICTDKTGTLTENRMTVTRIDFAGGAARDAAREGGGAGEEGAGGDGVTEAVVEHTEDPGRARFVIGGEAVDPAGREVLRRALTAGVLCNNASLEGETPVGDPMEVALLRVGRLAGLSREETIGSLPEEREEAFDSKVKMMATFHRRESGGWYEAIKGAPEAVLEGCTEIAGRDGARSMGRGERGRWLSRNERMAREGLRVLAVAERTADSLDEPPYRKMRFLGLVGLMDPPRLDVRRSIDLCRRAGIRIVMVTGDQPMTARSVALSVGLVDDEQTEVIGGADLTDPESMGEEERRRVLDAPIFSRVSPEQKLDIIGVHQKEGDIVAMTGDGVNDAPALKKADIGVAMGQRGTQVAQEASDMILKDDAFSSIVAAVEQGRVIFGNIREFVIYLLSCNVSEIMTVSLGTLVGGPLPILPLQILFLNLVTDVFPALALGVGPGDRGVMRRPPRDPREPVLTGRHWWGIAGYSGLITAAVLGALAVALLALGMDERRAVTISFLTLAASQLWHVFNMRSPGSPLLSNEITRNRYVWGALVLCVLLLLAAVYTPGLSEVLRLVDPGPSGWLLAVGMSLFPWLVGQVLLSVRKKPDHSS